MKRVIVGIVGKIGAGKSTTAEYLKREHRATVIRHSDILSELLRVLRLPETTPNKSAIGQAIARDDAFTREALVGRVLDDIRVATARAGDDPILIVIDGIRFMEEVSAYERQLGDAFHLLVLEALKETRFARLQSRVRLGEENLTREKFDDLELLYGNAGIDEILGYARTNDEALELDNNPIGEEVFLYAHLDQIVATLMRRAA